MASKKKEVPASTKHIITTHFGRDCLMLSHAHSNGEELVCYAYEDGELQIVATYASGAWVSVVKESATRDYGKEEE